MLVLPLKPTTRYDLMQALANWLDSDHHISFDNLQNPLQFVLPKPQFCSVACRDELLRLQSLRNGVSEVLTRSDAHAAMHADDLNEYHAILLEFEKRGFPTVDDPETAIHLTWKGAWSPSQESHAHIPWERAAVLFNAAALCSHKAASCQVNNRDDCKQAVSYYQTAATLFSILKQLVEPEDFATVDYSTPLLTFWESYFVAAAQSFVYRILSLTGTDDAAKHKNLSALAQSAHLLYNTALTAAQDPRLSSELPKFATGLWAPFSKAQAMIHSAKAEYHQAVVHRVSHEYGLEIARLRVSHDKFLACQEFCEGIDGDVVEYVLKECQVMRPAAYDRLSTVEKDNYAVYQETVPKRIDELPSKQLAKAKDQLPEKMLIPKKKLFITV